MVSFPVLPWLSAGADTTQTLFRPVDLPNLRSPATIAVVPKHCRAVRKESQTDAHVSARRGTNAAAMPTGSEPEPIYSGERL